MYNCPVRWYTVVDEMSVDEVSWNQSTLQRQSGLKTGGHVS